jgi:hypothetical protein
VARHNISETAGSRLVAKLRAHQHGEIALGTPCVSDNRAILKRAAQMFNYAGCLPNWNSNKYDVSVTCGVGYVVRRLVDHPQRQRMLDICATPPYTDYSINNVCAFKRRSQ